MDVLEIIVGVENLKQLEVTCITLLRKGYQQDRNFFQNAMQTASIPEGFRDDPLAHVALYLLAHNSQRQKKSI